VKKVLIRQKGLLILALAMTLFLLGTELAFLGMVETTVNRVVQMKRREAANSLSNMGVNYAQMMQKKHGDRFIDRMLKTGKMENMARPDGTSLNQYKFTSPPLIKTGYFTLNFKTRGNRIVELVSTGRFEGITYKKQVNLK